MLPFPVVCFTLSASSSGPCTAIAKMRAMVMMMQAHCNAALLELRQGRFLGSARISRRKDDHHWQVDYDLQIAKRKGVTYDQIYKLVNAIQPVPFRIERRT